MNTTVHPAHRADAITLIGRGRQVARLRIFACYVGKSCNDEALKEVVITSVRPIRLLVVALVLIGASFDASLFTEFLVVVGLEDRAARIAGSRLTVMSALVGAGFLLISIAVWARNTRMHAISTAHAEMLAYLATEHAGHVEVLPGVGAGFTGEIAGLRVEIVIEPTRGGQVWIRALCPAARPLRIWPRGLAPDVMAADQHRVGSGPSWEAWSSSTEALHGEVVHPIEAAFFQAGVGEIRHNRNGIEVTMSNGPGAGLLERIAAGLNAAAALSRANR